MAEIQVVFTQIGETQTIELNAPRTGNVSGASEERSTPAVPAEKGK